MLKKHGYKAKKLLIKILVLNLQNLLMASYQGGLKPGPNRILIHTYHFTQINSKTLNMTLQNGRRQEKGPWRKITIYQ